MEVEQVDFVSVPTRDIERAVAWYRDVLGLPLSEFTAGYRVQVRGRLVEHQDLRIAGQYGGQCRASALATGQMQR